MSAVKAASHTNKMAAAVKPLTTAKPKRAAIRPTEERAKAPTEMRVLLTWTGIFLELIRRTTRSLTPWLTGAGARSAEGTDIGHENAEGMAYVGVRVEPTVRLGTEVEGGSRHESFDWDLRRTA